MGMYTHIIYPTLNGDVHDVHQWVQSTKNSASKFWFLPPSADVFWSWKRCLGLSLVRVIASCVAEQVFGSSVDTQIDDNLWRSTKINHSNFPIPSLSLERSCRMPPTDQPSFKPFTNKIREVELTRVASSKPQRSTRLFGCGRTAKRFMQCSFSHSMVHGCDGNICSSLPKPMCSTSKLQVWKSHLSESRRDVLDVFGNMLRGRWLVYP